MFRIISLLFLFGALFAGTAGASTVTSDGSVVTYEAAPGEGNSVLVGVSPYDTACGGVPTPCMTISDSGARITQLSGGCVLTGTSEIFGDDAACPLPDRLVTSLGDRDDAYWDWDGDSRIDAGAGSDNPIFGKGGDDVITGGPGGDVLIGSEGNDDIDGGLGDDYLDGIIGGYPDENWTHGSDRYTGGGGVDAVTYEGRTEDLSLSVDDVANDGAPGENDDVGADIRVVYGGQGSDTLTGNAGRNDLGGMSGDDVLAGDDGDDQLAGGLGHDLLAGDDGQDVLQGDDGDDVLVGGPGPDRFWGDDLNGCVALSCGSGQDQIAARDGIAEAVNCGPGVDVAEGDAVDVVYTQDPTTDQCETADGFARVAPPTGEPGPQGQGPQGPAAAPAAQAPAAAFRLTGANVDRKRGRVVLRLAVPGPGKVTARVTARAGRTIPVARGARTVSEAGEVVLRMKVGRAARRVLGGRRRVKVSLKTTFAPAGGGTPSVLSSSVVLRRSR